MGASRRSRWKPERPDASNATARSKCGAESPGCLQSWGRGRGKAGFLPYPRGCTKSGMHSPGQNSRCSPDRESGSHAPRSPGERQRSFGVGCRGGSLAGSIARGCGRCRLSRQQAALGGTRSSRHPRHPPHPRLRLPRSLPGDPATPARARLTLAQQRGQHQAQRPGPRRPPRGRALGAHRGRCHATDRQPRPRAGCPMPGAATGSALAPAAAREPVGTTFLRCSRGPADPAPPGPPTSDPPTIPSGSAHLRPRPRPDGWRMPERRDRP